MGLIDYSQQVDWELRRARAVRRQPAAGNGWQLGLQGLGAPSQTSPNPCRGGACHHGPQHGQAGSRQLRRATCLVDLLLQHELVQAAVMMDLASNLQGSGKEVRAIKGHCIVELSAWSRQRSPTQHLHQHTLRMPCGPGWWWVTQGRGSPSVTCLLCHHASTPHTTAPGVACQQLPPSQQQRQPILSARSDGRISSASATDAPF